VGNFRFDARQNYQCAVIQLDMSYRFAWPCKCMPLILHIVNYMWILTRVKIVRTTYVECVYFLYDAVMDLQMFDARQNYQRAVIQLDMSHRFARPCKWQPRISHIFNLILILTRVKLVRAKLKLYSDHIWMQLRRHKRRWAAWSNAKLIARGRSSGLYSRLCQSCSRVADSFFFSAS